MKNTYYKLNNIYHVFKIKTKYILINRFILLFIIIIIMIFPILFLATKHFIYNNKVKTIMKERNKIKDSLYIFKLPINSTHIKLNIL